MVRDFDERWDYARPAETEATFRALLSGAPDPAYRNELLTQVARAQGLQQKFDEAHLTLDTVDQSLGGRVLVRYLLERGRVYNSSGEKPEALPLFIEALDLASSQGEEFLAVDAAHMLGIVEEGEAGLGWNRRAIDLAEKASDPKARTWLGSLYNNTGWTLHDMGSLDEALDLFHRAVEFRKDQGDRPRWLIARYCVGRCLRSMGRTYEALQHQLELEGERDGDDPYVREEIGECLLSLGRAEEARPHFAAAYEGLKDDPWLTRDEPQRLERLRTLAQRPVSAPKQATKNNSA